MFFLFLGIFFFIYFLMLMGLIYNSSNLYWFKIIMVVTGTSEVGNKYNKINIIKHIWQDF